MASTGYNEFDPVLNIHTPEMQIATSGIGMNQKVDPTETKPMKNKVGFAPAVIVGSLLGLNNWRNKKNKEREQQAIINSLPIYEPVPESTHQKKEKKVNDFFESTGNFYHDMEKIRNNLDVKFTPFGVNYFLKEKRKEFPVETIELEEMTADMRRAWERQNKALFLNLMYSNIMSRASVAESMFAKRMLLKHTGLVKHAEEVEEDYSVVDLDNYIEKAGELIQTSSLAERIYEKLAEEVTDGEDFYEFDFELPRPFSIYAEELDFLGEEKLAFRPLGFATNKGKYFNQSYLKRNIKPVFMPDRVLFIANNDLISTLGTLAMNEDGYEHFLEKDKRYFKNLFLEEAKKNIDLVNWQAVKNREKFEKRAEEEELEPLTPADAFIRADVHPIIYFDLLNQKYGAEWYHLDPYVLIKNIEVDFTKNVPIDSDALNKILSIQSLNNSSTPYSSYHAFEKIVRSFNDKAIDFERRENEDLDSFSFAFAIDIMEKVTPTIDVYGRFSPDVIDYIAQTLAKREIYLYAPTVGVYTPYREYFISILNIRLVDALKQFFENSATTAPERKISEHVKEIASLTAKVLDNLSEDNTIDELTKYFCQGDEQKENVVRVQAKLALAVDEEIRKKDKLLEQQRIIFGVTPIEVVVSDGRKPEN